jgi:crotonobetaine/carnitine-CoA ligase
MPFDQTLLLPQLLQRRALERGDEVCVDVVDGDSRTYAELDAGVRQWAAAYQRLGVDAGDTVLTMLPNRLEAFSAWLGAAWLRAIEVPVNTAYRGYLLRHVLNDSRATVMVVDERFVPVLAEVASELEHLRTVVVLGDASVAGAIDLPVLDVQEFLEGAEPKELDGPAHYDTACMIYTSGTTGPSKGVLMSWRELYEFPGYMPDGFFVTGRGYYLVLPLFHVSGKQGIWSAALYGARLVIRDGFSVSNFWSDIKAYDCPTTSLLGAMGAMLFKAPPHPDEEGSPLESVSMGPMIAELDEFRERFGVRVTSGFGMTEIGVALATDGYNVSDWRSCGRPRAGYDLRIVDGYDEEVPVGTVGELVVRTAEPWMVCSGYWNQPEKNAAVWRNGWFHTGDGFRKDEAGNFYFCDRIKDAIRRRGENISSFEVEAYAMEHDGVLEVAAIGVASDVTEEDVKIVVVRKPDQELEAAELHEFLRPRMPKFMVPRYIEFVDALPKTPTLRVQKVELRRDPVNAKTWDAEKEAARA